MSLQQRLLILIGSSFVLLWLVVAIWLFKDLDREMQRTLDERLASSARMVSGLIEQIPADVWQDVETSNLLTNKDFGVACQVRAEQDVVLQTHEQLPNWLGEEKTGFTEREFNGEKWRIYTRENDGLFISTADKINDRHLLSKSILIASSIPFLVALFGSLISLWLGIRQTLKPLNTLQAALSRRTPDTLCPIHIKTSSAELKLVVQSLNDLLARVEEAIQREQRFTSDAAHELRTPLTALKTHIQLALRSDKESADDFLQDAEQATERLQVILQQLLTLARVESNGEWSEEPSVSAQQIIELAKVDLPTKQNIHVEATTKHKEALVAAPAQLAAIALRNLLENALFHSNTESPITISVEQHKKDISFHVIDQGEQLSDEVLSKLSQRFWRNSQSQGSGLGLAITEAICKRFNGQLRLQARPEGGLMATITFPLHRNK